MNLENPWYEVPYSLRDLRVAEVVEQDIALGSDGQIESFRIKLRVSFKYEAPWVQPT